VCNQHAIPEQPLDVAGDVLEGRGESEKVLIETVQPRRPGRAARVHERLVLAAEAQSSVEHERGELDDPTARPSPRRLDVDDEVLASSPATR
jgi:hypothetical protein